MVKSEEGGTLLSKWETVSSDIDTSALEIVEQWKELSKTDYGDALEQPVLKRRLDRSIAVNLNNEVC